MSVFDRLFSRQPPAPPWAGKMSGAAYARFLELVEEECKMRGRPYRLERTEGVVHIDHSCTGEYNPCGLQNVSQLCAAYPQKEWPAIVRDHFARLESIISDDVSVEAMSSDFESVRSLLKVRLYPPDYPLDKCVYDRPADDFIAALVFDMPQSVVAVSPDIVARWPLSKEELFRIARENVGSEPGITCETHDLGDGCRIRSLTGESFFTASQALLLERYLPQPLSEMGALVAVPHRHMVLFHPIGDSTVVTALNRMLPMAQGIFDEGPGSVSPSVYWWREAAWWHDGQFTRFIVANDGRKMNVAIPDEFTTKVLERIA